MFVLFRGAIAHFTAFPGSHAMTVSRGIESTRSLRFSRRDMVAGVIPRVSTPQSRAFRRLLEVHFLRDDLSGTVPGFSATGAG